MTGLKLIEAGLSAEKMALIAIPMVPIQIMLPWIIRYVRITVVIVVPSADVDAKVLQKFSQF